MSGFEIEFPMFPSEKDMKELTKQVAKDRFKVIGGKKDDEQENDNESQD